MHLDVRLRESKRILGKYPDRIPIICEKVEGNSIARMPKQKYLIPSDICLGQFIYSIRRNIRLSEEKAIYMYIDGNIPTVSGNWLDVSTCERMIKWMLMI